MKRTGRTERLALLLALLVALPLLPAGQAQTGLMPASVSVSFDEGQLRLQPMEAARVARGTVEVQLSAPSAETIEVALEVSRGPAWAGVRIEPPQLRLQAEPGQQVARGAFTIEVRADGRAPAFVGAPLVVEARSSRTWSHDGAVGEGSLQLLAEYRGLVDVQTSGSAARVVPNVASSVPIKMVNLGNADTRVSIEIVDNAHGLQVHLPGAVVLESAATGGRDVERVVEVRVSAPDGFQSPGRLTLVVRPVYAADPAVEGERVPLELTVVGEGAGSPAVRPAGQPLTGHGEALRDDDGSLIVQTGGGDGREGQEGAGGWPWAGALLGGAAGFLLARRRLIGSG